MKDTTQEAKCPFGFGAADGAKPDLAAATGTTEPTFKHSALATAMARDKLPSLVREKIEPGAGGVQTGRCLCGAVSYKLNKRAEKVFAYHDAQSRRWTGGVAMSVMLRATSTEFHGWGHIVQYPVSDAQVNCFCRICGTSLFVRYTQPEMMDGMISLSAGTLDSTDGMSLAAETYIDAKPEFYSFAGERRYMTTDEVEAVQGTGCAPQRPH